MSIEIPNSVYFAIPDYFDDEDRVFKLCFKHAFQAMFKNPELPIGGRIEDRDILSGPACYYCQLLYLEEKDVPAMSDISVWIVDHEVEIKDIVEKGIFKGETDEGNG